MTFDELCLRCANEALYCMPAIDMSHRERREMLDHATEAVRRVLEPYLKASETERLLQQASQLEHAYRSDMLPDEFDEMLSDVTLQIKTFLSKRQR